MSYPIEEIEGIGPAYGQKLLAAGIKSTADLLKLCCDAKGRKTIAASTGITEKHLLAWANMADLMRINGIGCQFAELLEASGVDTVKELRTRVPANLAAKMKEVNETRKLAKSTPTESMIEKWVAEAKSMEPTITH